jgi:ATP-dependent exoDNAse (exonuclease V) beta subunit
VPYPVFRTLEDYFHALMHVMLVLTGMRVQAEEPTNTGRIDQVLDTGSHIYVFEYKLDQPAQEALAQIIAKGYAEKYRATGKPITRVGISFSTQDRNLAEWVA